MVISLEGPKNSLAKKGKTFMSLLNDGTLSNPSASARTRARLSVSSSEAFSQRLSINPAGNSLYLL